MSNLFVSKYAPAIHRSLIALACAAGLAAAPAFAQDPGTAPAAPPSQQQPAHGDWQGRGHGGPERQLEHLTKALNLTPEQVSQIKTIQSGTRQQMEALHADTATPQADKRARMMSLRQTEQASIKAVLNDDQKSKLEAMQAKMRERREEHEQGPPPPPPAL